MPTSSSSKDDVNSETCSSSETDSSDSEENEDIQATQHHSQPTLSSVPSQPSAPDSNEGDNQHHVTGIGKNLPYAGHSATAESHGMHI